MKLKLVFLVCIVVDIGRWLFWHCHVNIEQSNENRNHIKIDKAELNHELVMNQNQIGHESTN